LPRFLPHDYPLPAASASLAETTREIELEDMSGITEKIRKNLREGTLLSKGWRALKNRSLKFLRTSNLRVPFDAQRRRTRAYLAGIPPLDAEQFPAGNYFLDRRRPLGAESVVYSFGILKDIEFDEAVANRFGCPVHMFDPTPVTRQFMAHYATDARFDYHPIGVWTENTTLTFFEPELSGSASVVFGDAQAGTFQAECYTVAEIMRRCGHPKIDVFKADIEGAALPVLEQMVGEGILPDQIIVELERPLSSVSAIDDFFTRVSGLREALRTAGYAEYQLPRRAARYFSLELLFVKLPD